MNIDIFFSKYVEIGRKTISNNFFCYAMGVLILTDSDIWSMFQVLFAEVEPIKIFLLRHDKS